MIHALVIDDFDVSSESDDLLTYFSLEAQDDTKRKYHHHEAHRNTPCSNMNSGPRQAMSLGALAKQTAGYGDFKGQVNRLTIHN